MTETPRVNRKLAAILSADVVGYSKLMADDEAATVDTLKQYRAAVSRVIERHKGRVVNAPGDNILAEFPSAVEAVAAAHEIQQILKGRNLELPADRRMDFRIGINLGDVIEEDDGTIYGDGVNIAARMEALADAGGICVASSIFDAVEGKLDFGFDFLGEQQVKNIEKPVRVYRVRGELAEEPKKPTTGRTKQFTIIGATGVLVVAIAGVLIWQIGKGPASEQTELAAIERMAYPLPDEPSIAVLPFDNLSSSAEHGFIADGLSENIIAALSQARGMLVIARNSTFTYKGKAVKVQQVAEELGVQYVLEGSVQIIGEQMRVTAQLVDALSGQHLWSNRYDRALTDVFAVQDEITLDVVSALQIELTEGPQALAWRGGTRSVEAWSLHSQGVVLLRRNTTEDNNTARQMFERAVALDPDYALGWVYLAYTYLNAGRYGFDSDFEAVMSAASEHNSKALAIEPDFADAHAQRALLIMLWRHEHSEASKLAWHAVALAPNHSVVAAISSEVIGRAGDPNSGIDLIERAKRLSPVYPPWYSLELANFHFLAGQYEQMIAPAEDVSQRMPHMWWGPSQLLAAYTALGRAEEARSALDDVLDIKPDFSITSWREFMKVSFPYSAEDLDAWISVYRAAGVPE
jgi:adenylate cyclase